MANVRPEDQDRYERDLRKVLSALKQLGTSTIAELVRKTGLYQNRVRAIVTQEVKLVRRSGGPGGSRPSLFSLKV
jgi:hypothetical protein